MLFAFLALIQCTKKIYLPEIYRKHIFDKDFHLFIRKLAQYATKKNDDEEGIHVSFDYKFPWERNDEEDRIKLRKPFIPPYVTYPHIPYRTNDEDEEGIHVSFDYKFPWERNDEEERIKPRRPITPPFYPKPHFPIYANNDDEEGIHVSFDYKFPWERNGEINWGKIGQIAGDVIDVMGTSEFKKLIHDITGNAVKEVKINKRIYDLFHSQKLPLLIKLYKVYKHK